MPPSSSLSRTLGVPEIMNTQTHLEENVLLYSCGHGISPNALSRASRNLPKTLEVAVVLSAPPTERESPLQQAFPTAATDTSEGAAAPASSSSSTPAWHGCPGCLRHLRRDDATHSRVPGICKFPLDQPATWTCPGCVATVPRDDHRHNYLLGECK